MKNPQRKAPGGEEPGQRKIRAKYANQGGKGIPRPFVLAGALVLAGAAFLFWPRGGSSPVGIGENSTVVVAPDPAGSAGDAPPQSGNVDIAEASMQMVPERPGAGTQSSQPSAPATTDKPARERDSANQPDKAADSAPAQPSRQTPARPPQQTPAQPPVQPQAAGSWAIQVGAFGNDTNANSYVARLQEMGHVAQVRVGNTADGTMVYRAWIAYFQSRQDAETYARAHRQQLGDAIVVHR